MPCKHKFFNDLNLSYIKDYDPETLIIGTFNPEDCCIDKKNEAKWFYGRTEDNFFWYILPKIFGEESMLDGTVDDWKKFCREKKIAITDMIKEFEINGKLKNFSDKEICEKASKIKWNNLCNLLCNFSSIKYIYLTRGIFTTENEFKYFWDSFKESYKNKYTIKELLTPSKIFISSSFSHNKRTTHNIIDKPNVLDYIFDKWKNEWPVIKLNEKNYL